MTTRAKIGCQPCRISHTKCDQALPTCGRCHATGRECFKNYSFKNHNRVKFRSDQKWLLSPRNLTFVDETNTFSRTSDSYAESEPEVEFPGYISPLPPRPLANLQTRVESQSLRDDSSKRLPSQQDVNAATLLTEISYNHEGANLQLRRTLSEPAAEYPHGVSLSPLPTSTANSPLVSDPSKVTPLNLQNVEAAPEEKREADEIGFIGSPIWPLGSKSEALLLRHYTQNLATWLDLCDPKRHFETYVPQRAGSCRILLNAIFALSARHLSRTGSYDPYASERYHQECLKNLIPMLNHSATIMDEDLFAATIILRVLEEMDVATVGEDTLGHMLGIQVFVNASHPYVMPGSLSEAAFWVGLRQEIYSAIMKHQAIKLNLEHWSVDRSTESTSDCGWSNRAVTHCADVINLCFSDMGISVASWKTLKEYNESWEASKPLSFTPIYHQAADRSKAEAFPEIWYQHTCHVIAVQHHILAELLLALFDPTIPKVGSGRRTALKAMKKHIGQRLRDLCGIGLCNRWMPPGMFTASMGISLCGDRLHDRIDQEALLDVLVKTEKDHARPTAAVQQQLMKAWGWIPED